MFRFLIALLLTFSIVQTAQAAEKIALVYRGPGGCNSCAAAAAKVARAAGFKVEFVSASKMDKSTFENVAVWLQPAGNGITAAEALGKDKLEMIRSFVRNGGGYVGFCAGAFLADTNVDDEGKVKGLGFIPFSSADYMPEVEDTTLVWTKWGRERRQLFFYGGATFNIPPSKLPLVRILATYERDDMPAAIALKYGKGGVVLAGPHPEAPSIWKTRDGLRDTDGVDYDLAVKMIKLASPK